MIKFMKVKNDIMCAATFFHVQKKIENKPPKIGLYLLLLIWNFI